MLIASKANLKRVTVYVFVMIGMLFGTGFMIYDNFIKDSTPGSYPEIIPVPADNGTLTFPLETAVPAEDGDPGFPAGESAKNENIDVIKNIDLVADKRFIDLKEVIVEPATGKPGKDNPFTPYTQ
ncbi:MAG: hypothetical protein WCW25_03580 [Patescibacteria group bacterium]|jgi:hypothetical protein